MGINGAAAAHQDAGRVNDHDLSVSLEQSVDLGRIAAQNAIERRRVGAWLNETRDFTRTDGKRVPVDDHLVAGLVDRGESIPLVRDGCRAGLHGPAQRVGVRPKRGHGQQNDRQKYSTTLIHRMPVVIRCKAWLMGSSDPKFSLASTEFLGFGASPRAPMSTGERGPEAYGRKGKAARLSPLTGMDAFRTRARKRRSRERVVCPPLAQSHAGVRVKTSMRGAIVPGAEAHNETRYWANHRKLNWRGSGSRRTNRRALAWVCAEQMSRQ